MSSVGSDEAMIGGATSSPSRSLSELNDGNRSSVKVCSILQGLTPISFLTFLLLRKNPHSRNMRRRSRHL